MIADKDFGRSSPLTWVGSYPVYLATAIAGVQAVAMVLTSLAMAFSGPDPFGSGVLSVLSFSWESAALQGRLWQFVSYVFVNPPSLWMLIQLLMFVMFGSEVEKFLGRHQFLWLYVALILAGPLLLCLLGLAGINRPLVGSDTVHFGIFLAFVLIYPKAEIFFGIQARWVAAALLGIYTLMGLASQDFTGVSLLWWSGAAAFVYLRWEGVASSLMPVPEDRPAKALKRRPATKKVRRESDLHESIDPILEKISRQGISSLTREEKLRLERARAALMDKEKPDA
jgi:membrane associated rhomboid family serine protease